MAFNNDTGFKVGDKVNTSPNGPIGTVREVDAAGIHVAWPVKGRMFPVLRLETTYSIRHVKP
jgi:hypothetical protein